LPSSAEVPGIAALNEILTRDDLRIVAGFERPAPSGS